MYKKNIGERIIWARVQKNGHYNNRVTNYSLINNFTVRQTKNQ